jgi:hypothetical protein
MDSYDVLELCRNCRNFINCVQIIRKPDPFYTVKCPCFNTLNLKIIERKQDNEQIK